MTAVRQAIPEQVAEWGLRLAARPLDGAEKAFRSRLLDFAANLIGGSSAPPSAIVRRYTETIPGSVLAPGGSSTAENAAFAYGIAAHALECDDTHQPSSTHPGTVQFSTALALGAELDASLEDVARAVVTGYEVMCRLGEAAGPAAQYERGFHPTGTCGVFGAAAAAGVLLGFTHEELSRALGLAVAFSSGSMAFLQGGGWSKLLNAGHAATSGIVAARLAALGYDAPTESIDGPHGFLAGHSEAPLVELIAEPEEGEPLAIERTSTKAHGCCRYEQGAIDAILELRARHAFDPHDVKAVDIGVLAAGWDIIANPIDVKRRPSTVVESQFSMPFGAAVAIVRGRAAPADHSLSNLADPEIRAIMDLVSCHRDQSLDEAFPHKWPCTVEIALYDSESLNARIEHPKGDPENPLSESELVEKLRALAPDASDSTVDSLANLLLHADLRTVRAPEVVENLSRMWIGS
jgi:2-methylcitrate dehydratase PrpD